MKIFMRMIAVTMLLIGSLGAMELDYYSILEVPKNVSDQNLKKAYNKQVLKWHPDKNPGKEEEAKDMFVRISTAYKVLSDSETRAQYDAGTYSSQKDSSSAEYATEKGASETYQEVLSSFKNAKGPWDWLWVIVKCETYQELYGSAFPNDYVTLLCKILQVRLSDYKRIEHQKKIAEFEKDLREVEKEVSQIRTLLDAASEDTMGETVILKMELDNAKNGVVVLEKLVKKPFPSSTFTPHERGKHIFSIWKLVNSLADKSNEAYEKNDFDTVIDYYGKFRDAISGAPFNLELEVVCKRQEGWSFFEKIRKLQEEGRSLTEQLHVFLKEDSIMGWSYFIVLCNKVGTPISLNLRLLAEAKLAYLNGEKNFLSNVDKRVIGGLADSQMYLRADRFIEFKKEIDWLKHLNIYFKEMFPEHKLSEKAKNAYDKALELDKLYSSN